MLTPDKVPQSIVERRVLEKAQRAYPSPVDVLCAELTRGLITTPDEARALCAATIESLAARGLVQICRYVMARDAMESLRLTEKGLSLFRDRTASS